MPSYIIGDSYPITGLEKLGGHADLLMEFWSILQLFKQIQPFFGDIVYAPV